MENLKGDLSETGFPQRKDLWRKKLMPAKRKPHAAITLAVGIPSDSAIGVFDGVVKLQPKIEFMSNR